MIPLRDRNPTRRTPVVTLTLIGACFAAFALELSVTATGGDPALETFFRQWGAVPADVTAALGSGNYFSQATLGVLTSMFLHGSWLHIIGNMLFLWIFGNNVEDRFGRIVFVVFYLVVGALAFGAHFAFNQQSTVPVLGASGAIAGVMGAYLMLWPRARVLTLLFFVVIPLPAAVVLALWFGMQFLTDTSSQVAWIAHVGGFIGGTLLALALARLIKSPSPPTTEPPDTWLLHP